MAHVCAQGPGVTLFETLKFIRKAVVHLTFAQETLERVLSPGVLTYQSSSLPGPTCIFVLYVVPRYFFLLC